MGCTALGAVVLFRIASGGPFTTIDLVVDPILVVIGIILGVVALVQAVKAIGIGRAVRLLPRANGA